MKKRKKKNLIKKGKIKNKNSLVTVGSIGAIVGLLIVRGLLDYIRENNLSHSYIISIYVFVVFIAIIGAIRLGKKSNKMKNSIFLCISIISFISLYYLGNIIKNIYPQYNHIYKVPIGIGMVISMAFGVLMLFSLSNENKL